MKYIVKIRHANGFEVKPEAEQIDGMIFNFIESWIMDENDTSIYIGERAMIPDDKNYPLDAPSWIASGDLELIQ